MLQVEQLKAICKLDFHTQKDLYSVYGVRNPSDELLMCTTTKQLNSPAGIWSVELIGDYYADKISPMDIVVIQMGREAKKLSTVMIGLVDSVFVTEQISGNTPSIRTQIKGRDFGKLLLKAVIQRFPMLSEDDNALSALSGTQVLLGLQSFFMENGIETGTPTEFIDTILRVLLTKIMRITFPYWQNGSMRQGQLENILNYQLQEMPYTVPWHTTRDMFEGSIWNFIESARNQPFHEIFVDTRSSSEFNSVVRSPARQGGGGVVFGDDSAKIGVFMRSTPFSPPDWKALPTHDVLDKDIIKRSIGRSDHEHYNMFRVHPKIDLLGNSFATDAYIPPKFNIKELERYGLSFLDVSFEGMFEDDQQLELTEVSSKLTDLLQSWYSNNHKLESGTFVLKGNGNYRIGQRIRHVRRDMVYYIEGVTQSFQNFGKWQTTLSVTRGDKE